MFWGAGIKEIDFSGFDTLKVESAASMFCECSNLEKVSIGGFDNCKELYQLFYGCSKLKDLNIENLHTGSATMMSSMFAGCESLETLDVSGFDTSSCTDFEIMFFGCKGLNSLDLSSFDMTNAASDRGTSLLHELNSVRTIKSPRNINADIDLPAGSTSGKWIDENGEECTYFHKGLSESVTYTFIADGSDDGEVFEKDGWQYKYIGSVSENGIEICGYTGSETELDIPSSIDGIAVAGIGAGAFAESETLTSMTIPDGVTYIGSNAFYFCDGLESVEIPDSVTRIGGYAFAICQSLRTVNIPQNLTAIGEEVFSHTALTSISIPENVTSIGKNAFYYCRDLKNVPLPKSLETLNEGAFRNSGLESVFIPENVSSIGLDVFAECEKISEFVVDEKNAALCSKEGVLFNKEMTILYQYPAGDKREEYAVPDGVTMLYNRGFSCSRNLKSIILPDSLESIGGCEFYNCTSLTGITFPQNVKGCGNHAFYGCSSFEALTVLAPTPPNLVSFALVIEDSETYERVSKIYVPAEYIEAYKKADEWSSYADRILAIATETKQETKQETKTDKPSVTETVQKQDKKSEAAVGMVLRANELVVGKTDQAAGIAVPAGSTFTITSNTNNDYACAFDGVADENAAPVKIPGSVIYNGIEYRVTTVSPKAFEKSVENAGYKVTDNRIESLTVEYTGQVNAKKTKKTVSIPEYSNYRGIRFKVTSIAAKSFRKNTKVTKVKIASSITMIGANSFEGCSKLQQVTVGKGLREIGKNAFKNCKNLKTIIIKSSKLKKVGAKALKGVNAKCKIKVPKDKVKAYQKLFKGKGQKKSVKVVKA